MTTIVDKTPLWSFVEVAALLGLGRTHGKRTVSDLVEAHGLVTRRGGNPNGKYLDRDGVDYVARLLNKTVEWPD